jgi:DNA repair exonuclease SbcCD ATPase subunit
MSEEATATTHEFNKDLQQVQQEKANFQKRSQELEGSVQDLESQNRSLRDQLNATPDPVASEDSLDAYEQVEQSKKDIQMLRGQLAKNEVLLNSQDRTLRSINQVADYEKQLKAFDGTFGAENRNAALARATKRCTNAGYTLEGSDCPPYDQMMTVVKESYIHEYYQSKDKKVTEKPTSDNGLGGSNFVDLGDVIPEGSAEEVLEAMRKQRQNE